MGAAAGAMSGVMSGISMGSQIGGGIMSAFGAYGDAKSQRSALNYQANMAEINARMADTSAEVELIRGNAEVGRLTLQHGQHRGQQRAALAANGVDLGEGSAAEVQASSELLNEMDMDTLRSNVVRAAWGHRAEATNYRTQAMMSRGAAKSISPGMAGFTSLLGSAGSVADSWYKFNKEGLFGSTAKSTSTGKSLNKGKLVGKY